MVVERKRGAATPTTPPGEITVPNDEGSEAFFANDSLREIFGPGSGAKIIREDDDEYNIPDEIVEVLQANDLWKPNRTWQCMLKELGSDDAENDSMASYVKSWRNGVPTIDCIAKNWGPGAYVLVFTFKKRDVEDGKTKSVSEKIQIRISQKYMPVYRQHQMKKRLHEVQQTREALKDAHLDKFMDENLDPLNALAPKQNGPATDPKEYVNEVLTFAEKMGLTRKQGLDWDKILGLVVPALPLVLKYFDDKASAERERNERFMTLMLSQSQSSTSTLVELMKNVQGPRDGSAMIEEFGKMVFGALDIRDALTGKESTMDKVMGMIEKFLPLIITFASMPKQARQINPGYQAATAYIGASPEIQQILQDPAKRSMMIRKLDSHYGWEQTDRILSVMEIARPEDCPRMEHEQYPDGDERNPTEQTAVEPQEEEVAQ